MKQYELMLVEGKLYFPIWFQEYMASLTIEQKDELSRYLRNSIMNWELEFERLVDAKPGYMPQAEDKKRHVEYIKTGKS